MRPTTNYSEIIDTRDMKIGMFVKINRRWYWAASTARSVAGSGKSYDWTAQLISRENIQQEHAIWRDQVEVARGDRVPTPFLASSLRRDARKLEQAAEGLLNRAGGMIRQARAIERMTGA